MATQTIMQPYYAGSQINRERWFVGGPEYTHIKETASQSYGIGDLLYADSNGTIAIATVDSGTPTLLSSPVAGIAIKKATGTTGQNVLFPAILCTDLFFMNVHHETPSSAVTAQTDLFDVRSVCKSSGYWKVSKDAAGESATLAVGHVSILGFPLRHPIGQTLVTIGDIGGLVLVKWNVFSHSTDAGADPAGIRVLQLSS